MQASTRIKVDADMVEADFGNSDSRDLSDFARALSRGAPQTSQKLLLNFQGSDRLSDVSVLGASIASLSALKHLQIDFDKCVQLPEALRGRVRAKRVSKWVPNGCSHEYDGFNSREDLAKVSTAFHGCGWLLVAFEKCWPFTGSSI